jgi:hypothetical protein
MYLTVQTIFVYNHCTSRGLGTNGSRAGKQAEGGGIESSNSPSHLLDIAVRSCEESSFSTTVLQYPSSTWQLHQASPNSRARYQVHHWLRLPPCPRSAALALHLSHGGSSASTSGQDSRVLKAAIGRSWTQKRIAESLAYKLKASQVALLMPS